MRVRKATEDDAVFLAQCILIAGRAHVQKGIWEVILGGDEDDCLSFLTELAVTRKSHLFHYTCSFIAEDDSGKPLGSLAGHDPKTNGYPALQEALPEVVETLHLSSEMFEESMVRSERILCCMPQQLDGAWVIDSVAVLPSERGKGVAGKLLERVIEEGEKRGHERIQISMYLGNKAAENLYRKHGFEFVEEKLDTYFEEQIGSPGMVSLKKELN